jgi:hypothetical protein
MTSPLRMKRPINHRARTISAATGVSWLALLFLSSGSIARAQEAPPPPPPPPFPEVAAVIPNQAPAPMPPDGSAKAAALAPVVTADFLGVPGGQADIQQTVQELPARLKDRLEDTYDFSVTTELPGPERLFRRQSEKDFFERIREDYLAKGPGGGRVIFPEEPPLTTEPFRRPQFPRLVEGVEPAYVCHGRLLFEQPNFERQGWNLGILTPVCNLGIYYYDLALLPYHAWTRPVQRMDCSAGKCLPGDPTPLYLYHEEFSVSGLAAQAAVVTGLFFLFP